MTKLRRVFLRRLKSDLDRLLSGEDAMGILAQTFVETCGTCFSVTAWAEAYNIVCFGGKGFCEYIIQLTEMMCA